MGVLLDILLPSHCVICGRPVASGENHLCRGCYENVTVIEEKCPRCSGAMVEETCSLCSDRAVYFDRNISIFPYSGTGRTLLKRYKFQGVKGLHRPLGEMASAWIEETARRCDLFTSVPIKSKKKWNRGFNQSALVARNLAKRFGRPYRDLLICGGSSTTQKDLSYSERFINVIGSFAVKGAHLFPGKRIILVDDVLTTGATMNECSRILKEAGASHVTGLTLARTDLHGLS